MSDNNHDKLCKKIAALIAERQVLETQLMVIIRSREKVKEEIERFCWMAVHEHKHGVLPSEYDIREIDEDLYLELLQEFK